MMYIVTFINRYTTKVLSTVNFKNIVWPDLDRSGESKNDENYSEINYSNPTLLSWRECEYD